MRRSTQGKGAGGRELKREERGSVQVRGGGGGWWDHRRGGRRSVGTGKATGGRTKITSEAIWCTEHGETLVPTRGEAQEVSGGDRT